MGDPKLPENPFRIGNQGASHVAPCVVIIFGVTGDLAHRKLVAALYNLRVDGLLPANFSLVGFARRPFTHETFRKGISESVEKFSRRKPVREDIWSEFASRAYYNQSEFDDAEGYVRLRKLLDEIDQQLGSKAQRVFYFATAPEFFDTISHQLAGAGLLDGNASGSRVIVEKPFGNDLESARVLNRQLRKVMSEEQIYRIDHYLGKETVQNLLVFRFANGIFEPIWNHKYISHVEISMCESIGVEGRAGYFDQSGVLRDIVQNHVLQLLCLVALEPPVAFEADAVRDEKVKVLRSIRRYSKEDARKKVIRARYQSGHVAGRAVDGYLAEPGVSPDSTTETYVALELAIDNWRWSGVPFYLRSGKRLAKRVTDISIFFRNVPYRLFQDEAVTHVLPNVLSFQIQPDEGISLKISAKPPGPQVQVQPVSMNFSYGSSFGEDPPDAYERLLLDSMRADATLFTRSDEIEWAWDLLEPILAAWRDTSPSAPPIYGYDAGTWGPKAAEELLQNRIGKGWRRL